MQKTKKQHYVPRCYLKAFVIPGTLQVHVYDKVTKRPRINSYEDVASENYFHDLSLTEEERSIITEVLGVNEKCIDDIDVQYIEHLFARDIEPVFSNLLERLRSSADNYTPWYIKNCRILNIQQKIEFAFMLALQYIRTKGTRNRISDMLDCFQQAVEAGAASGKKEVWSKYLDVNVKDTHNQMLMDSDNVLQLALSFLKHKWCLFINRTGIPIITSDNPITTRAHVWNGPIAMGGIDSEGVEIAFPIAPNAILVMVDDNYHSLQIHDLAFIPMDEEAVEYYNTMQVARAERCLFSPTNDFSVVDRILSKHPDLFDMPSMSLSWGGKVFYPKERG